MSLNKTLEALRGGPFAFLVTLTECILLLYLYIVPVFVILSIIGINSWIVDLFRVNHYPVPFEVQFPLIYTVLGTVFAPGIFMAVLYSTDYPWTIIFVSVVSFGLNIYMIVMLKDNFHVDASKNMLYLQAMALGDLKGEGYVNPNQAQVLVRMFMVLLVFLAVFNFFVVSVGVVYKSVKLVKKYKEWREARNDMELDTL